MTTNGKSARPPAKGALDAARLQRVTGHMQDNLSRGVTLSELAPIAGLSAAHLCRAFRQATGITPHRWHARRRIAHTQDLLRAGDLGLSAVALAAGFADQSHFTNAFRRSVGISPGAWRRTLAA